MTGNQRSPCATQKESFIRKDRDALVRGAQVGVHEGGARRTILLTGGRRIATASYLEVQQTVNQLIF